MSLWTAREAAKATGGEARGHWAATGVSIDTRTLEPGDLFVALKAERDGHDFVAQALGKGAAAALVSRVPEDVPPDAPLLIVGDVLSGLTELGRAGRARSEARIVGVTGSAGKTSTKEMLRAVLSRFGPTHAAVASYNNHWGVPLTLARMPRDARFGIIEIGMNAPGEIAPLSRLARPHVAVITTIAAAHLEAFPDLDAIAVEKGSIFEGLEPGGTAVINGDVPQAGILGDAAGEARRLTFGETPGCDIRATRIDLGESASEVEVSLPSGTLSFTLGTPGRHMAMNALGVLGVALALDLDPRRAAEALSDWRAPKGRGTRETLALGDRRIDLIDDAFNANPASMAAALDVLTAIPAPHRRVAILGDMLELGPSERQLHAEIAHLPAMKHIDLVHCVGPRCEALWAALPEARRGLWSASADEMASQAEALVQDGDIVLVKGSKGSLVSRVVDMLRARATRKEPT